MENTSFRSKAAALLLFLAVPIGAAAQSTAGQAGDQRLSVRGSVGPTVIDIGNSFNLSMGYSPNPQLTFLLTAERDHLNHREDRFSTFRGGTIMTVGGEVQYALLPRARVSPYVLAGAGLGLSRPNVEGPFDRAVTNTIRTQYAGAGVRVPLTPRLSLIADARVMLTIERDVLMGIVPIRAGVAWTF